MTLQVKGYQTIEAETREEVSALPTSDNRHNGVEAVQRLRADPVTQLAQSSPSPRP